MQPLEMEMHTLWARCKASWQNWSVDGRKQALGLSFILAVALIWVLASFLVQDLETGGLNPFLLTYIANSLFIVYLPIYYFSRKLAASKPTSRQPDDAAAGATTTTGSTHQPVATEDEDAILLSVADNWLPSQDKPQLYGLDKQILQAAAVVAPLWFAAQYTFNVSLLETTVTSNTILASTSSLFTYALSCALFLEVFVVSKLAFIFLCMAGTALVTFGDAAQSDAGKQSSVGGDLLVLLSGMCYAGYTIAIRKMLHDDNSMAVMLLFGCIGLLNAVCLAPVLLILHLAGSVHFAGLSARVLGLTVCKGLFDNVLSDYLWARAVMLVGPTVATVGLSMQVPLAVALDAIFKRPAWLSSASSASFMFGGASLVLAGFFGINAGGATS